MTRVDDKVRPKVAQTLITYGVSVTLRELQDNFSPATGDNPQSSPSEYTVFMSPPFPFDQGLVDGDVVRATDLMSIIAAADTSDVDVTFEPEPMWRLDFDSVTYVIVTVKPIWSGAKKAAWELQLRR